MRTRDEIEDEFTARNEFSEFKRHNEQILEVLLDIRELLQEQKVSPHVTIKYRYDGEATEDVAVPTYRRLKSGFPKK